MSEHKDRPLPRRLHNGLRGLAQGWRRERSLRTQVVASVLALIVLIATRPPMPWLLAVPVMLALALAAELANAALEALLDRLHPGFDADIGAAKDMSSAAVLVANIAAAAVFVVALFERFD